MPSLENWGSGLKIFYGQTTLPTHPHVHMYDVISIMNDVIPLTVFLFLVLLLEVVFLPPLLPLPLLPGVLLTPPLFLPPNTHNEVQQCSK